MKTRAHIAHGARKRRVHGEETARDEVVYLEFLRGSPGVPRLLGRRLSAEHELEFDADAAVGEFARLANDRGQHRRLD